MKQLYNHETESEQNQAYVSDYFKDEDFSNNESLESTYETYEKDRSKSRKKHLAEVKAKKHNKEMAKILQTKLEHLPYNATYEQRLRAYDKVHNTLKKVASERT